MPKNIRYFFLFIFFLFLGYSCTNSTENTIKENLNETIPVYNYEELEPLLNTKSDKTYLINFWAMWCAPCVKELPYIQEFAKNNPEIEVILVSMDFPEDIETELKPFLTKKNITTQVVLLDDPDANTWINKIDPSWSGAIPFTIIFNKNKRFYYERSFENAMDIENELNKNF